MLQLAQTLTTNLKEKLRVRDFTRLLRLSKCLCHRSKRPTPTPIKGDTPLFQANDVTTAAMSKSITTTTCLPLFPLLLSLLYPATIPTLPCGSETDNLRKTNAYV